MMIVLNLEMTLVPCWASFFDASCQAVIEPDGRILLMYHGSTCLSRHDPERLTGERLGIAEAAHWNASFVKRPGGPIVAPSNGTGSHGTSICALHYSNLAA